MNVVIVRTDLAQSYLCSWGRRLTVWHPLKQWWSNILIDIVHSLYTITDAKVAQTYTQQTNAQALQNNQALFGCLCKSLAGDLYTHFYSHTGRIPQPSDGITTMPTEVQWWKQSHPKPLSIPSSPRQRPHLRSWKWTKRNSSSISLKSIKPWMKSSPAWIKVHFMRWARIKAVYTITLKCTRRSSSPLNGKIMWTLQIAKSLVEVYQHTSNCTTKQKRKYQELDLFAGEYQPSTSTQSEKFIAILGDVKKETKAAMEMAKSDNDKHKKPADSTSTKEDSKHKEFQHYQHRSSTPSPQEQRRKPYRENETQDHKGTKRFYHHHAPTHRDGILRCSHCF